MNFSDIFFKAIGIDRNDDLSTRKFSRMTGIPVERLKYYNNMNTFPTGTDLEVNDSMFLLGLKDKMEMLITVFNLNTMKDRT